jgi:adenylate kinase
VDGADRVAAEAVAAVSPSRVGRCRRCGGRLVQRADDSDGVVLERLKVYHRQTEPLVQYYRHRPTFRSVNGAQLPDQVAEALARAIDGATGSDGSGRP